MDEEAMKGRAVVLSLGLASATVGLVSQLEPIETRPVEARLTDSSAYISGKANASEADLRALRGRLLAELQPEGLQRAVQDYERNAKVRPGDAGAWNNLAAAYFSRSQVRDDPRDLLRAYAAALRAVELDDSLLEARFNKALVLESLFLPEAARSAWQDYVDRDRSSGLAREGYKRLRDAQAHAGVVIVWDEKQALLREAAIRDDGAQVKDIVEQYRQAAREYAELRLLGDWGEALLSGKSETANDHLSVLRAIGDALASTSGELLVRDSVRAINEAMNTTDKERLNEIAQGAIDFREGYKLYKKRQTDPAAKRLTSARERLRQAKCALALRADFYLVSNDYVARKYQDAVTGAGRLARQIEAAEFSYGALLGHLHWIRGMSEATLGRTSAAIKDLDRSLTYFQVLGESENIASINCRLGEVLMSRGRKNEAWASIYRALRSTPDLRDPDQASAVYMIAGNAALQDEFDDAALAFQEERVRQANLSKDNALTKVEALTSLARFQHHRGDDVGAEDSLSRAEGLIKYVEAEHQPRRLADLNMIKGLMIEERYPAAAAEFLSKALPVYEAENNVVFSLWTYLARGRAYRKDGKTDKAQHDFEAALARYGEMGEKLELEDLRLALLEETDAVFDEMVALQADQNDPDRAFAYADRARTLVLPGSASKLWTGLPEETSRLLAAEPQSLSLDEIRRRLPEGITLVQYSVLRDRVLIWTMRRSGKGEHFLEKQIQRAELEELVGRLLTFDSDWEPVARELSSLLIQPWISSLPVGEKIVFVPDKVLHQVPFDVLREGSTRLIEARTLMIAPSATLYVNALERQGAQLPGRLKGLVVGEPAIDRNVPGNDNLAWLPAAAKEAEQLAGQREAEILVGSYATKAAFLAAAPRAEWIQFSGHAVIDPVNTLLSRLVLAPSRADEVPDPDRGTLTAREIYSLKLAGTRLVVLAACETGNEYVPGSEGVTSLARAFLAAGVPTVVASLWSVDDAATAELFGFFHEEMRKGVDPAEALRAAKIRMLRNKNTNYQLPRAWAAFEVIGASAYGQP